MDDIGSFFHEIALTLCVSAAIGIAGYLWKKSRFPSKPSYGKPIPDIAAQGVRWWFGTWGLALSQVWVISRMCLSNSPLVHFLMWLAVVAEFLLVCWAFHLESPIRLFRKIQAKTLRFWDWIIPAFEVGYPLVVMLLLAKFVYLDPKVKAARQALADYQNNIAHVQNGLPAVTVDLTTVAVTHSAATQP